MIAASNHKTSHHENSSMVHHLSGPTHVCSRSKHSQDHGRRLNPICQPNTPRRLNPICQPNSEHHDNKAHVRANEDKRTTWLETPLRSSVLSFECCYCHQVFLSSNPQFFALPMDGFFTRRAGPPTTAWPQRHDEEEDFLALVQHNAAAQLEMERWPPALKKRGVEKPTMDEQYTQALCNWVATLEALPQAKRPGWWRHGMSLIG